MIFFILLLVSFLAIYGFKKAESKEDRLCAAAIFITIFSLLPSIHTPYIIDDTEHLYAVSTAMESSKVMEWIFQPYNEHVIPTLKYLYFLFYKYFWIYPQGFHFIIIAIVASILLLTYNCLLKITNSKLAALVGTIMLTSTNLMDNALFVMANAHIAFCLAFFLLLFYSQYKYMEERKAKWLFMFFLSLILVPTTFALGLLSLVLVPLFDYCCIPKKFKKPKDNFLFIAFLGWTVSFIPYLISIGQIIYAKQYNFLGKSSVFQIMNIPKAVVVLCMYFVNDLIPYFFFNPYLSFGLFYFVIITAIVYRQHVEWKKVFFFFFFAYLIMLIIYIFRVAWDPLYLSVSRYNVFPAMMISGIYVLCLAPLIKMKSEKVHQYRLAIYLVCFVCLSYSANLRYKKAEAIATETSQSLQKFNIDYRDAFIDYFKKYPQEENLLVQDYVIFFNVESLRTRKGFNPDLTRYPRALSFYAQYILPPDIKNRLRWGQTTDPTFTEFLQKSKDSAYVSIKNIFGI